MKYYRHLSYILLLGLFWFLYATSGYASDDTFIYSSAIQRSKFLQSDDGDDSYMSRLLLANEDRRSLVLWQLGMQGGDVATDGNFQSRLAGFYSRAKFRYQLLDRVKLQADGKLQYQTGRTQELFGDFEPNSGIFFSEAYLGGTITSAAVDSMIMVGVVHQGLFENPIFLKGSVGFPGLRESIGISRKRFSVELVAQQVIPTSRTLATRVQDREAVPTLFSETLQGSISLSKSNWLRGSFSLFEYNDLPSVVAYESQRRGNLGFGGDANNSSFSHEFKGWIANVMVEQKMTESLAAQLSVSSIRNSAAPDKVNEGQRLFGVVSYDLGRWIFSTHGESFFAEHDVVPAAYNDWLRGHNNRRGWGAGLGAESKDHNFRVTLDYFNSRLINSGTVVADSLQQENWQAVLVSLETAYDAL